MNRIQKESLHKVNDIDKIARDYFKKNKKGNITNIAIDQNDKLKAPRERYLLDAGFKYIEELVNEIDDNQPTADYTSATEILLEKVQNHVKHTAKIGFVDAVFLASIDSATKKLKEKFEEDSTTDITELRQIIDDTLKQTSSKFKSLEVSKEMDFYITKSVETSNISSDNNLIDKLLQENPKDLHEIIYNKLLDSSIAERISLVKAMIEKKETYTKNKNQLEKVIRATVKTIQFLTAEQIENTIDKELFLDAILSLKTLVVECKKHKVAIEIDDNIAKSMLGKLDEYLTDNDMPDTDNIITIYNLFDPKDQAMSAFFFKNNEALLKNVRQSINDSIVRCLIDLTDTTKSEKQFDRFNHLRDMLEQLNKKHINIEVKDKKLMQSVVQYYSDITDLIKEKPANFDLLFKFNEEIKKDYNNNTLKDMLTRSLFNTKIDKKLKAKILEKADNICNTATSINNSIKESVTVDNKCNTINANESKFKDLITDNYELQQQVFNSTSKETIVDLNNKIQQNNASLKILTREIINGRSEIIKLADNTKITVFKEYELLFYPIAITVENGEDITQNYLDNSNAELDSRACTAVLIQLLNDDATRAMYKKLSMGSTITPEYKTTVANRSLFSGVKEHMNNIVNKDNYDFTTAHYVLMQTIKDDRLTKYNSTNYVDFITTTFTEKLSETYQQINDNKTELQQPMLNSMDEQALSEIIDNQQLKGKAKVASTITVAASEADKSVLQHKKLRAKRPTTPPPPPPTDITATVAKPVPLPAATAATDNITNQDKVSYIGENISLQKGSILSLHEFKNVNIIAIPINTDAQNIDGLAKKILEKLGNGYKKSLADSLSDHMKKNNGMPLSSFNTERSIDNNILGEYLTRIVYAEKPKLQKGEYEKANSAEQENFKDTLKNCYSNLLYNILSAEAHGIVLPIIGADETNIPIDVSFDACIQAINENPKFSQSAKQIKFILDTTNEDPAKIATIDKQLSDLKTKFNKQQDKVAKIATQIVNSPEKVPPGTQVGSYGPMTSHLYPAQQMTPEFIQSVFKNAEIQRYNTPAKGFEFYDSNGKNIKSFFTLERHKEGALEAVENLLNNNSDINPSDVALSIAGNDGQTFGGLANVHKSNKNGRLGLRNEDGIAEITNYSLNDAKGKTKGGQEEQVCRKLLENICADSQDNVKIANEVNQNLLTIEYNGKRQPVRGLKLDPDNPLKFTTQTYQGIDFTTTTNPQDYAGTFTITNMPISKTTNLVDKKTNEISGITTVFTGAPCRKSTGKGGTMDNTVNKQAQNSFDFTCEAIKQSLIGFFTTAASNGAKYVFPSQNGIGIYAKDDVEKDLFKPAGDFKMADGTGGKFVEILNEALEEKVGPNGEMLKYYFKEVILTDLPLKKTKDD